MLHSVKKIRQSPKLPLEKNTKTQTIFFPINVSSAYLNTPDFHINYVA